MSKQVGSLLVVVIIFSLLVGGQPAARPPVAANQPVVSQPIASQSLPVVSRSAAERKLDPELLAQLASKPTRLEYLVFLNQEANTGNDISPLHWAVNGEYVYHTLVEV